MSRSGGFASKVSCRGCLEVIAVVAAAACGRPAPSTTTPADVARDGPRIAAYADEPWYCGFRCARSGGECRRMTSHGLTDRRAVVAPRCQRVAAAYCLSYTYTLADTAPSPLRVRYRLGRAWRDRTPRSGRECFATWIECNQAWDERGRSGYWVTSSCTRID